MRNAAARFEIRMQFKFNNNDARSFRNGILAFAAQSTIGMYILSGIRLELLQLFCQHNF